MCLRASETAIVSTATDDLFVWEKPINVFHVILDTRAVGSVRGPGRGTTLHRESISQRRGRTDRPRPTRTKHGLSLKLLATAGIIFLYRPGWFTVGRVHKCEKGSFFRHFYGGLFL